MCLNALSHNSFTPIHKQLKGILTSTKDSITFDGLKACLQFKASNIHHTNQAIAAEEALTAIATKKPSSRVTCANCLVIQNTSAGVLAAPEKSVLVKARVKLAHPETYSGVSDLKEFKVFVAGILRWLKMNCLLGSTSVNTQVNYIATCLTGKAQEWFL